VFSVLFFCWGQVIRIVAPKAILGCRRCRSAIHAWPDSPKMGSPSPKLSHKMRTCMPWSHPASVRGHNRIATNTLPVKASSTPVRLVAHYCKKYILDSGLGITVAALWVVGSISATRSTQGTTLGGCTGHRPPQGDLTPPCSSRAKIAERRWTLSLISSWYCGFTQFHNHLYD
jgi:hypothetical protein